MSKQMTTKEFIEKAKSVHGDKYDYSECDYFRSYARVKIICPNHGVFEQIPYGHLKGEGCSECVGVKRYSTQEFIQKAELVHGDKYDYSELIYTNSYTKVKIICKIHGVFEQSPTPHLRGNGCSICARNQVTSTQEFVQRARLVHGNRYDYSESIYITRTQDVKITCRDHGVFYQSPKSHYRGAGCHSCAGMKKSNTQEFIQKAKLVYEDQYDYSECQYINNRTKVKIICPKHGAFYKTPDTHLSGQECRVCYSKRIIPKKQRNFIHRSRLIHEDKYDYSECVFVHSEEKVRIICSSHGMFEQRPSSHLRGKGCIQCSGRGFDHTQPGLVYFLKFEKPFVTFWKVGITNRTVSERFGKDFSFVTGQHTWDLDVGSDAHKIEQAVLKKFEKYKFSGRFLFSLLEKGGDTECFEMTLPVKRVISFIEKQVQAIPATSQCAQLA